MNVALVDYGAGNATSVRKALTAAGATFFTPRDPEALASADAIVIPGVGHFQATAALDEGWKQAIGASVTSGRHVLGICLGMQWLFEGSTEAPPLRGLGALRGTCEHLGSGGTIDGNRPVKVPHVGWNDLTPRRPSRLLGGIGPGSQLYFTHSYAAPITDVCTASSAHGHAFAAIVESGSLYGVQFHPEKSGEVGLQLLRNFFALARR